LHRPIRTHPLPAQGTVEGIRGRCSVPPSAHLSPRGGPLHGDIAANPGGFERQPVDPCDTAAVERRGWHDSWPPVDLSGVRSLG
jgi:hypothetical protein